MGVVTPPPPLLNFETKQKKKKKIKKRETVTCMLLNIFKSLKVKLILLFLGLGTFLMDI